LFRIQPPNLQATPPRTPVACPSRRLRTGAEQLTAGFGHHPEIILSGGRAYLFYFVQFGRRSSIQVVELKYDPVKNTLTCDRNAPCLINLQPPVDPEKESKVD